jgi:hypothetical protein
MSSIVERLTEGVVNRDMRAESHALLSKWKKTGLLEGLEDERKQGAMSRLLENQAKELLREANTMSGGSVEGFAAVAFPIVRRVFAGLIANDLVSVQPMSLPSGLIFFLDFTFSGDLGGLEDAQTSRFGNIADKSIYGTDQVAKGIVDGVDLVDARGGDLGGPRTVGGNGYNYSSPSGSNTLVAAGTGHLAVQDVFTLDGSVSSARKKLIDFDPDLLANTDGTLSVVIVDIKQSVFDQADYNNMAGFSFLGIAAGAAGTTDILACLDNIAGISFTGYTTTSQVRRLTRKVAAASAATSVDAVRFYLIGTGTFTEGTTGASALTVAAGNIQFPQTDDFTTGGGLGSVVGREVWGLEGNADIPEIDIKVNSIAVTAQTKKLKAKWTPELGQDLNAYHNLDAEVELTSILSEQIALEIDREILADLVRGATAATRYWSRAPGLFVDSNGNELGASTAAPDFTGTVSEWYETLVETINDVSAQIHRKTLRGGANFVVCGPEVANILEFTAGFRASVTHDDEKGSIGALRTGSLSKKFDVIVDPYFLRNVILVGRRGASFLESGYVYAPYVPLQTTPTIFGPEDFVPRKGVMTRYAKKMVRPDMYGLVVVRGLLGEQYST